MSKRSKKVKLAVFDIDGTVFRSSLIIELFNELVRRGVFADDAQTEVNSSYQAWLNRKGHYNDYLMRLVRVFYKHIAGCSVQKIEQIVRIVIARQKDRVYRYPRHLIGEFRKEGYLMLVISNSPEMLVRRFAETLKFDASVGHKLEIKDGSYTSRSIVAGQPRPGIAFMDKVRVLKNFINERELDVDLRHSVMVGDSEGDLPLMNFLGHSIAFNPSEPLAHIAFKKKWRVVVERKDAVYQIDSAKLLTVDGLTAKVPYGNKK